MARRYKLDPIRKDNSGRRQSQIYDDLFGGPIEPLPIDSQGGSQGGSGAGVGGGSGSLRPVPIAGGGSGGSAGGGGGSAADSMAGSSTPSLANTANAPDIAQAAMPGIGGRLAGAAVKGLQGLTGSYGVVGGSPAPDVGTLGFAQQTPAMDTPPGVPDPGAQAMAAMNQDLSPQAAFGNKAAPAPQMDMNVADALADPLGGLAGMAVDAVSSPDQDTTAVAGNTPSGQGGGPVGGGPTGIGGIGNNTTGQSHASTGPGGMASGGRAGPAGGGGGGGDGGAAGGTGGLGGVGGVGGATGHGSPGSGTSSAPGGQAAGGSGGPGGGGGDSGGRVICTELVRQGRMTPRQLAIGTRWLYDYHSGLAFRGYHAWAIPTVRLMRRSPKLSWLMEKLFVARAEQIQSYYGIGKPTLRGFAARKVIEPLSWLVGIGVWLVGRRPEPQVLYSKKESR